jgi:hypothetical protein
MSNGCERISLASLAEKLCQPAFYGRNFLPAVFAAMSSPRPAYMVATVSFWISSGICFLQYPQHPLPPDG